MLEILKIKICFILGIILIMGCASHTFIPMTGEKYKSLSEGCPVQILREAPKDKKYTELGICKASVTGGGIISDKTTEAIKEVKKCVCENEGNAIILQMPGEGGIYTEFGYSQQRVNISGHVLLLEENVKDSN